MLSNLNERYLLRFISNAGAGEDVRKASLLELLYSFGVKIDFANENPVYDIIDKFEYCGICYE